MRVGHEKTKSAGLSKRKKKPDQETCFNWSIRHWAFVKTMSYSQKVVPSTFRGALKMGAHSDP